MVDKRHQKTTGETLVGWKAVAGLLVTAERAKIGTCAKGPVVAVVPIAGRRELSQFSRAPPGHPREAVVGGGRRKWDCPLPCGEGGFCRKNQDSSGRRHDNRQSPHWCGLERGVRAAHAGGVSRRETSRTDKNVCPPRITKRGGSIRTRRDRFRGARRPRTSSRRLPRRSSCSFSLTAVSCMTACVS